MPKCHFNKAALHNQTMFTKSEGKGMVFDIFLSFPSVSAILFKPKEAVINFPSWHTTL